MSNIDFSQMITAADKAAAEQDRRRAGVNAMRDSLIAAGALIGLTGYGDIPVRGTPGDQFNLLGLGQTADQMIAAGVTSPIPFRDAENMMHALAPVQVAELVRKAKEFASAVYAASWAIKDGGDIPADFAADARWPDPGFPGG